MRRIYGGIYICRLPLSPRRFLQRHKLPIQRIKAQNCAVLKKAREQDGCERNDDENVLDVQAVVTKNTKWTRAHERNYSIFLDCQE